MALAASVSSREIVDAATHIAAATSPAKLDCKYKAPLLCCLLFGNRLRDSRAGAALDETAAGNRPNATVVCALAPHRSYGGESPAP